MAGRGEIEDEEVKRMMEGEEGEEGGIDADELAVATEMDDDGDEGMANDDDDEGNDDDDEDEEMEVAGDDEAPPSEQVYLPGDDAGEGELVMDTSAYICHAEFSLEWPCLSFDVMPDGLGDARTSFPMSCYLVAGTQARESHLNSVTVMRIENITRIKGDADNSDDEEEDDDDDEPQMYHRSIPHRGGVNRVRVAPFEGCVAATWSETGKVHMWDLSPLAQAVQDPKNAPRKVNSKPMHTFSGHKDEGFAMDWSKISKLKFASGDCSGRIHVWDYHGDATWVVSSKFGRHDASVEDIQWSPNEETVFASCSADRTIRIWDTRQGPRECLKWTAHDQDVNVISWNTREQASFLSGGDDGIFKLWDFRMFQEQPFQPTGVFKWHTQPITSVEWHPTDSTVLAVSGDDDQISLWDTAVESDDTTGEAQVFNGREVPPQLLFVHQGQKNIKELHWHPQIPGMLISTAESGFNIFKTISTE
ncbi:glutamate-rich WD repeat containing 1 [Salpingoeca rosetta]|uniref:Glutamate-rich WD repeat-containing protein 1 n=1 Tax=Salpingoeca rosetta (strain ATCC 50818 / BSB-021) TaxID=946362 RepID=F2U4P3_SALR5|nr:glutamate-rich WD repeat containing 1 [Salpingoeca rosetta]EGD82609.1 glutamate-rich WD repeat containing 1 [Salpingoeca rosetta]|eukprot:XP_004995845.1 glutamate-rich WD repeat containing 1 [Salpingoeca rosetta]